MISPLYIYFYSPVTAWYIHILLLPWLFFTWLWNQPIRTSLAYTDIFFLLRLAVIGWYYVCKSLNSLAAWFLLCSFSKVFMCIITNINIIFFMIKINFCTGNNVVITCWLFILFVSQYKNAQLISSLWHWVVWVLYYKSNARACVVFFCDSIVEHITSLVTHTLPKFQTILVEKYWSLAQEH